MDLTPCALVMFNIQLYMNLKYTLSSYEEVCIRVDNATSMNITNGTKAVVYDGNCVLVHSFVGRYRKDGLYYR